MSENPLDWKLRVTMPDGSRYDVPVRLIAEDRARWLAKVDGVSFEESLNEDTIPCFKGDTYQIEDWASNNMNWDDVKAHAVRVGEPAPVDFDDGWTNGDKRVIRE
jgi:hypothetical protein